MFSPTPLTGLRTARAALQPVLKRLLLCVCLVAPLLAGFAFAGTPASPKSGTGVEPIPATPQHIADLREGGFVIYMRHGATDARIPDQIPVVLEDCASQRPLTEAGRTQLDEIGRHFAKLRLPHLLPVSSPFCRAVESARRVFGEPIEVDIDLRYTAAMPSAEKAPAVVRTRYWVSLPVDEPRTNRVVVAHGPNIAEIMEYLPREATMVIFRPLGLSAEPSFEYVASIEPAHWPVLLEALGIE
ncbi:MAG TPA: histidine phosphatase family protein [Azoarcus taiwanensis]|nr:histidine phosphatase family protein [Azoarcus taiwanensis]